MSMEKPTEESISKYPDVDELRGCRQISEVSIETVEFNEDSISTEKKPALSPRTETTSGKQALSRSSSSAADSGQGCSYASVVSGKITRSVRSYSDSSEARMSPESDGVGVKKGRPRSSTPKMTPTLEFSCGNPTVERVEGMIHLYKDSKKTSLSEGENRSELICMFGVPSSLNLHDLLSFTDPVFQGIEYMKVIKDMSSNHYMVLIKFRDQELADQFYTNYNNVQFNSIESDVCHLVYVARVDFLKGSEGGALPVPGLVELPNCPVCLERMDESVDGVLTILCNHSFHGHCLAKWGDTSCPVCRYMQTPEPSEENFCFECNANESLWICLICGQVGCGRYVGGHAYGHFERTNHTYAMQLSNGRVWDYVGDNYVHRLVQNKEDGKLVEMDERGQRASDEKIDSLTLEYTYLLTNQLESQRRYFEEKILHLEKEHDDKLKQFEIQYETAVSNQEDKASDLASLQKNKEQLDKRCEHLSTQLKKVLRQLQEEQALNTSLVTNQTHWQDKVTQLEKEKKAALEELKSTQEQLSDIMFHLEAQNKLAANSQVEQSELEEGTIVVGSTQSGSRRSKKKR